MVLPDTSVATNTPLGTPSTVPSNRCQPLSRVSAQELVPAKITNAAIAAQYQCDGDTVSPTTMGSAAATATWMAGRVDGSMPGGDCCSPACATGCSAAPAATRSIRLRTSAVA